MTAAMTALAIGSDQVARRRGRTPPYESLFFVGLLLFAMTLGLNLISESLRAPGAPEGSHLMAGRLAPLRIAGARPRRRCGEPWRATVETGAAGLFEAFLRRPRW